MNSYDVVSGIGTNINGINVKGLINLIDKTSNVEEAIVLAGVNIGIYFSDFRKVYI